MTDVSLKPGDKIVIGPRRDHDAKWTLRRSDGGTAILDHEAADAFLVRVDSD
jgi:hypothetical protein